MLTDSQLIAVVKRMPKRRRLALVLVQCDGLSYAETARRMNVSEKTVRKELTRAYEKLASLH